MNHISFRLLVMAPAMMLSMSARAAGIATGGYLEMRHIGAQDKFIPTLMITADEKVAASLKRDLTNRTQVLSRASFLRVRSFLKSGNRDHRPSCRASRTVAHFGTFEVSDRAHDGAVVSFCYVIPRESAISTFTGLRRYVSAQHLGEGLMNDVGDVILRIREAEPSE